VNSFFVPAVSAAASRSQRFSRNAAREERGFPGKGPRRLAPDLAAGRHLAPGRRRNETFALNLLDVVSGCVLDTKHSGSAGAVQALFAPQRRARKLPEKQRANADPPNDHPRIHRVSTALSTALICVRAADERTAPALQFYDTVMA
jgi:hypothetical protein